MKKQVRKTLGALFLASAVAVAAIPTTSYEGGVAEAEDASGNGGANRTQDYKVTLYRNSSEKSTKDTGNLTNAPTMDTLIPVVTKDDNIYTSGETSDGSEYQFAYKNFNGSWGAVILGFTKDTNLPGNVLTVPDVVDAYILYNSNNPQNGYVPASRSTEPLYYEKTTTATRTVQAKDEGGHPLWIDPDNSTANNVVYTTDDKGLDNVYYTSENYLVGEIVPCYTTDTNWQKLADNQFYVKDDTSAGAASVNSCQKLNSSNELEAQTYPGYAITTDLNHQWLRNVPVKYIGNQYVTMDTSTNWYTVTDSGNYVTASNPTDGVFAGAKNIGTLNIGSNLVGVGNYAFYHCTGLSQISFENGNALSTIGNWAFASCTGMTAVKMPQISNISQLGDHAFFGNTSLTKISVPRSVEYVGDYCFANCTILTDVNFCNSGSNNMEPSTSVLSELGWNVFESDSSLASFIFPDNFSGKVDLSTFKNCTSLRYIASHNFSGNIQFVDTDQVFTFTEFHDMIDQYLDGAFYFEAYPGSSISPTDIHKMTLEQCFAFSYLEYDATNNLHKKANRYEITVQELDSAGNPTSGAEYRSTYSVNDQNVLIYNTMGSGVETLSIPNQIGPYYINSIVDQCFANNCNITKVTIPANVKEIGKAAFKGCHNLVSVIFESDSVVIGEDAFKTQDFSAGVQHSDNCPSGKKVSTESDGSPTAKLCFVGPISSSSVPFEYAMSYAGRYNNGSQKVSFITYYSGWPTNLTVEYDYDETTGTGVSTLVDFPAYTELKANFGTASTKYDAYMTSALKQAAETALTTAEANRTEDQKAFLNSATNIVIPEGVEAIKDGLFYEKEQKDLGAVTRTVTAYGLKTVEAASVSDGDATVDATEEDYKNSDFMGCKYLTEVNLYGNTSIIEDRAFEGCERLEKATLNGNTKTIGSYAFKDCEALDDVSVSDSVQVLGNIPFTGCKNLSDVNFENSEYFTCDNSIIYGLDSSGNKVKVIEYLEGRSSTDVLSSELAGVTSIAPEAFAHTGVEEVNFSKSSISELPELSFAYTGSLYSVTLPSTAQRVATTAFLESGIKKITIPNANARLSTDSFKDHTNETTVYTPESGWAWNDALAMGLKVATVPKTYTVNFFDYDVSVGNFKKIAEEDYEEGTTLHTDEYPEASDAYPGHHFTGEWSPAVKDLSADVDTYAQYEEDEVIKWTVTYQDYDGTLLGTETVVDGGNSTWGSQIDHIPSRSGYTFSGWVKEEELTNVKSNVTVRANYDYGLYIIYNYFETAEDVAKGNSVEYTRDPVTEYGSSVVLRGEPAVTLSGYTFAGWTLSSNGARYAASAKVENVTSTMIFTAYYTDSGTTGYPTVRFWNSYGDYEDWRFNDGTDKSIYNAKVEMGVDLTETANRLARTLELADGETFARWGTDGSPLTKVTTDTNFYPFTTSSGSGGNTGTTYTVTFYDEDKTTLIGTSTVAAGGTAIPPYIPTKEGYTFAGWSQSVSNVTTNLTVYATYVVQSGGSDTPSVVTYTVNYYSYDGKTLVASHKVIAGENAPNIQAPARDGYTFAGWVPSLEKITADRDVAAAYDGVFNAEKNYYSLTVVNGSGSGSYVVGSQPIIVADDPAANLEFSSWTINPDSTVIASKALSATVVTMPASNVTVTANYKAKSSGSGSSTTRPTSSSTINNGGNTVVIDKNGLSNTGVVSAVVNGSSDNFTIKITDSSTASEAIIKALLNEYGDLTNIKYFPMDISLYDANGNTKITDTTGLSITITLPLPDSLKDYAGNNKVAGVVNNKLDKLTPRFTTISGVPCITFTAEHFSPYVIYVDTTNLVAGSTIDTTPKTGDRIHPKWFLSAGLALISVVLFMKKDSRPKKKLVKARS